MFKKNFWEKFNKKIKFYFIQKISNNFIFLVIFSIFWEQKIGFFKKSQKLLDIFFWLFRVPLDEVERNFLRKFEKKIIFVFKKFRTILFFLWFFRFFENVRSPLYSRLRGTRRASAACIQSYIPSKYEEKRRKLFILRPSVQLGPSGFVL